MSHYYHFVGHCGAFCGLKWRFWRAKMYFSPRDCSDCFVVIFFSFYFLNALQNDNNSNRVYVLGHKYVLGPSQTHFSPRLAARAKMSLSRAQNIFMPANINSIVILYHDLQKWHAYAWLFGPFCFHCSLVLYFLGAFFNKTIIPLALVGYEMIIANSALRASLAIYHLISNACSWNNC